MSLSDPHPTGPSSQQPSQPRAPRPGEPGFVERRGTTDRREVADQRRRDAGLPVTGLERRRGPGRRLSDFLKAAEEGEMNKEQFLFLMAIEGFKRANGVTFPAWSDVLEVVRLLGYRKTRRSEIKLPQCEDWMESPDAPSGVRTDRQIQRAKAAEQALERDLNPPASRDQSRDAA